ncbi:surface carbohydrate biosynthesis protein [Bradyrhizobium sp. cf659]|uniref:surface carbohydrate biosynthesis protein n=1 Tax=Bradyrhizobium sp. cf659 TaxID=1761771 RepID=UPI0008E24279|nr:surface carbohydrate biosynthesis protein [Bradyrhizobium sp. cf659]SFJ77604.1 surface carbohydrate biosynthesis protein [Bradyrhizobium sp. cf659]
MRIGLVVDHPKRDLPGAVMLGYQLARRGVSVMLVPMYEQAVDVPRLGLDALVVNYARPVNLDLMRSFAKAGLALYVLDTEGGVLAETGGNSPPAMAAHIRQSGYAAILAGYFFWGSRLHDAFLAAETMKPEQLHLTGCPRFDFAAPRWRALLDGEPRGYLLVNANFPLINSRFTGKPGGEREAMVRAGWDGAYVDRFIADLKQVFSNYLAEIDRLAAARPDRNILVRPHPFESEDVYRNALSRHANVLVDGTGSVLDRIRNAAAVVHLNCGTAVESVLLGKLPLQLDYLNTPTTAGHAALPARVSRSVASFEELLGAIDHIERETETFDFARVHAADIEAFFHLNDGLAAERVADVLTRTAGSRRPYVSLLATVKGTRDKPSIGQIVKGAASAVLGSAVTERLRSWFNPARRDKRIEPIFVNTLLQRIGTHDRASPAQFTARRAHCATTGLPLASIAIEPAR